MNDGPREEDRPNLDVPWAGAAWRAWRSRCPRCEEGRLFARYARLAPRCASCGLVFRREQGAMTGSMYLTAAVTQVFAATLILGLWFGTSLGTVACIAITLPLVGVFCAWFLPRSQSLWVAVEWCTDLRDAAASPGGD